MKNLSINRNRKLNTANFIRIGDISFFEGPLLSLFEELNSGHLYVFDWVDRDKKHNKWLIYRVLPKVLLQYLNKKISHFDLFNNRAESSTYYTDIDYRNQAFYNYDALELTQIPEDYLPNQDNFFEPEDCPALNRIKVVIMASLSKQKMANEYSNDANVPKLILEKPNVDVFNKISWEESTYRVKANTSVYIIPTSISYNSYTNTKNGPINLYEKFDKTRKLYANQYS